MITFSLLRPQLLWLLLPLLALAYNLYKSSQPLNSWRQICDPHLLPLLLRQENSSRYPWPLLCLGCAWLLTVIALSGPSFSQQALPVYQTQDVLVIALDVSEAMLSTDLPPNRMSRAKYKLLDLLQTRQQGQTALLAFTDYPFIVTPLVDDTNTLANLLKSISPEIMPVGGSHISRALAQAARLIQQANNKQGRILLVTSTTPTPEAEHLAAKLAQQGITTSVLAVGTESPTPISTKEGFLRDQYGKLLLLKTDFAALDRLARAGGGQLVRFSDDDQDLAALFAISSRKIKQQSEQKNVLKPKDSGYYFIWLLLPIVLFAFRRGRFDALVSR